MTTAHVFLYCLIDICNILCGRIKIGYSAILNQASRQAHAWFLKLFSSRKSSVCACACVHACICVHVTVSTPRLLVISGAMWHVCTPYDCLYKFYTFYITAVVSIISRCGPIQFEVCCRF